MGGDSVTVNAYKDDGADAPSTWSILSGPATIVGAGTSAEVIGTNASANNFDVIVNSVCDENGLTDDEMLTVVAVKSIKATPKVIAVGKSVSFEIKTQPEGYNYMVSYTPPDFNVPGSNDVVATCGTSAATCSVVVVGAEIEAFDRVAPTQTKQVNVTIIPSSLPAGYSVSLVCEPDPGTVGSATPSPATINETTEVTITGGAQSWGSGANPAPKNIKLKVKLGDDVCGEGEGFTVCAHVDDFHQTIGRDYSNGVLYFKYEWDSDSGNDPDLDKVLVGEHVDYPDNGVFPDPPFHNWKPWRDPTVMNLPGSDGKLEDYHRHCNPTAGESITAGPAATFTGIQHYRFHCQRCMPAGNQNDLNWGTILVGPINIERRVEQVGANWQYRIRKSGIDATLLLPYP